MRGIKSGLPVHDCFKIIGRESPSPLGPEFQKLVEGLGVGLTLSEALNKMYERMPTPELKFFSIVMAIQQKTGGNLAEAGAVSFMFEHVGLINYAVDAGDADTVFEAALEAGADDVVLVKGSRGVRTDLVVARLEAEWA